MADTSTLTGERNVQGDRYPGYGQCIYCGSDGGPEGLRDEHIIPLALNGDSVIEKACCVQCERLINKADTHLAKSIYWHFRLHTDAKTRNPKDRPSTMEALFDIGGEQVRKSFPIKEAPFTLALPIWGEAGLMRGAPIDAGFPEPHFHMFYWMPEDIGERLALDQDAEFRLWSGTRIDVELFCRALAKIAFCHMVLHYGLHGFRRLALPDIILGKSRAVPYFVGSPLRDPPRPSPTGQMHRVMIMDAQSLTGALRLHIVHIRLFANSSHGEHGMPWYHVIAGAPLATPVNR